jgi:hypothetical protein
VTTAAPPQPAAQPRPSQRAPQAGGRALEGSGDWPGSRTGRAAIADLAPALPVGSRLPGVPAERRWSADKMLAWLESLPGQTWQQRWQASGCETLGRAWIHVPAQFVQQASAVPIGRQRAWRIAITGIHALLCLDVIRPGYQWLLSCQLKSTYEHVRQLRDPDWCAQADAVCRDAGYRMRNQLDALMHLSRIMLHTGRGPRELTPGDLLAYHQEVTGLRRQVSSFTLTWDLMRRTGVFPPDTPSLGHARVRGQRSVAEMVDRYELACEPVRDVLVRYLSERAAAVDHSTLREVTGKLAGAFWKDLEEHHPGIDTLNLAPEVAEAWRRRAVRWRGGQDKARVDHYGVLFTVRAFYLDIAQWALEDPSWVPWAVPSPVRLDDVRGAMKNKRHRVARMHQRTRTLAPLLPQLVHGVETRLRYLERLAAAARQAAAGEQFSLDGQRFTRVRAVTDQARPSMAGAQRLRVRRDSNSEVTDLTQQEDEAFWTWAITETLRHTGMFSPGHPLRRKDDLRVCAAQRLME